MYGTARNREQFAAPRSLSPRVVLRPLPIGGRGSGLVAADACGAVSHFRTFLRATAQRFLCAAVMRGRAAGRTMRLCASPRANATVPLKPCGAVMSTRTQPVKGSAAIQPSIRLNEMLSGGLHGLLNTLRIARTGTCLSPPVLQPARLGPPLLRRRDDPRPPLGTEAALLPGGVRRRWRRRPGRLGFSRSRPAFLLRGGPCASGQHFDGLAATRPARWIAKVYALVSAESR